MNRTVTHSARETYELAGRFAGRLRPGDVVTLTGNLGSGKTQFVTGVCSALLATGHVASPTFTIINEYEAPFGKVVHMDFYRIRKQEEIRELGVEEYFSESCICLIEWPEIIADLLPRRHYRIEIEHGTFETERYISVSEAVPA